MTNIELIPAKDLPVTSAEEVDVLCVDPTTGDLSRKSGANLTGSGTSPDAIIDIEPTDTYFGGMTTDTPLIVTKGSFDDLLVKAKSGNVPNIIIRHNDSLKYGLLINVKVYSVTYDKNDTRLVFSCFYGMDNILSIQITMTKDSCVFSGIKKITMQ